jgi:selenocysteine-specific elongation factor
MSRGLADCIGQSLVAPGVRRALADALERLVRDHHRAQPLSGGLPREEARARLFGRSDPALFEQVLADLAASGRIAGRDRLVASGHVLALSGEEAEARSALQRVLADAGLTPPDTAALASSAGVAPEVAARMLTLLVRQKAIVRAGGVYFDAGALERLKQEVRMLKEGGTTTVDVASFKERYGLTRKYAIPLLEYLDRERVTRRQGEARLIL